MVNHALAKLQLAHMVFQIGCHYACLPSVPQRRFNASMMGATTSVSNFHCSIGRFQPTDAPPCQTTSSP